MPDNSAADRGPRPPRISRGGKGRRRKPRERSRRRTALVVSAWAVAAIVVVGGGLAGFAYAKLNGNLTSVDLDAKLGADRPEDVDNGSLDILVLGSDSRSGDNAKYGAEDGARSDTAMVVHLYDDRKKASVVSIPRDTLVSRPSCVQEDGATTPAAERVMFNSAYSTGGPACSVKTVEAMTGIRIDHFVEVDFTGFKKLIDKLGGVEITTTESIDDPDSHLKLSAGTHTLNGEQALGLVRTRHAIGDGSDLGRIKLQQTFIRALLEQVKDIGVFSSPTRLYGLADTATSSITTDKGLSSVTDLMNLAKSVRSIGSNDIQMVTLPVTYDTQDPNRVVPLTAQADEVWAALKADQAIPKSALKNSAAEETQKNDTTPDTANAG
ncbi:LCP family protein [Streptomyces sp. NPDC051940]|uniref:LCP family protein n=1 Tax=Streptomyces sp. NPDC051940 TaxID=3155675 RepID=UPI00341E0275